METTTKALTDQYVSKYTPDRGRMSTLLGAESDISGSGGHILTAGNSEKGAILHLEIFPFQSTIAVIYITSPVQRRLFFISGIFKKGGAPCLRAYRNASKKTSGVR
jgi:hypothetical protein